MMDWDDMRKTWQRHGTSNGKVRLERPGGASRIWRRVRSRDSLETLVAVLLVPFFGATAIWMFRESQWIPGVFALFLVGVIVYIPWRLWRTRRLIPQVDPDRSVREFLVAERSALAAQADMLRRVASWYYGPIAVGVIGFYTSIHGASLSSLIYALFVLVLCTAIEVVNRAAANTRFQRAIDEIDEQIHQLEDENHD